MTVERRHIRSVVAGPIRIVLEYARELDDEGPVISVWRHGGPSEARLLEFYCFSADPRYVYAPDGKCEVHHASDEGIVDMLEWTLHRLEKDLPDMLRRAGFGELAEQVDPATVARQLAEVHEALTSLEH